MNDLTNRKELKNILCILITFNNPLEGCFFYTKYSVTKQTRPTQIVNSYF